MGLKYEREGVVHAQSDTHQSESIWVLCEGDQELYTSFSMRKVPHGCEVTCVACLAALFRRRETP